MRIRTQQIAVPGSGGALIVGDGSGGGTVVAPSNTNQVPLFDGTGTSYVWLDKLYPNGTEALGASLSGSGDGNYIVAIRPAAGSPATIALSGTDVTNGDILLMPGTGGHVLLPSGYGSSITSPDSVATAGYVQTIAYSNDWKASVRLATAGVTDTSTLTYDTGTDTWTTLSTVSFDGVTLNDGDRVLIKDASDTRGNGIWVWDATATRMTRALDADTSVEIHPGMTVFVAEGTVNGQSVYVLTYPLTPATPGTDPMVFTKLVDTVIGNLSDGVGIHIEPTSSTIAVDWTSVPTLTTADDAQVLVVYNGTDHYALNRSDFLGSATIGLNGTNGVEFRNGTSPYGILFSPADGRFAFGFGTGDVRLVIDRATGTDASVRITNTTDGFLLPSGSTAARPTAPSAGTVRFNTTDSRVEYYDGTAWLQLFEAHYGYDEATVASASNAGGDFTFANFFTNVPLGAPANKAHIHVYVNGIGLSNSEFDVGGAGNQDLVVHQGALGYDLAAGDVVWARYVY